jgi:hypothetical protein
MVRDAHPTNWLYSSFHRFVKLGIYPTYWMFEHPDTLILVPKLCFTAIKLSGNGVQDLSCTGRKPLEFRAR